MDYQQEGQFPKFILAFFQLIYQELMVLVVGYWSSALSETSTLLSCYA